MRSLRSFAAKWIGQQNGGAKAARRGRLALLRSRATGGGTRRQAEATLSSSLERNNTYFREERDKLEKWADDALAGAERALSDTKEQIKGLTRQARTAPNLDEQQAIQPKIAELEKKKRRQRQQIFDVEDEIIGRRDRMIGDLINASLKKPPPRHSSPFDGR